MLETFHVQDPAALRAIAHPLRQRILMELAVLGHARATDLARATGEPANSVSFHLRVLAKAGMIVEAPEHARDRRDRVWKNVAESYAVEPGAPDAVRHVVRPALAWAEETFRRGSEMGAREDRILALSTLVLSPAQAAAMAREVQELLERWNTRSLDEGRASPQERRETYQALAVLAPRDLPPADEASGEDTESPGA
ncbi:helix-turn-helix transcriptional regulator [Cellulosimicrobium cellulans]|uniref:ArsR/SmtB family transcription factor n=1 Tax=Cellulosimicrobium cellulans TaxID=1710 RepID=UPI0019628CB2|nr:winged helix-turn-helix domain-containing protein [Cellulosimicrobium cellulans]MBN0040492.1 helix-turn-helix transcriptional regulator [Cellulosimicrobium cellulans]